MLGNSKVIVNSPLTSEYHCLNNVSNISLREIGFLNIRLCLGVGFYDNVYHYRSLH